MKNKKIYIREEIKFKNFYLDLEFFEGEIKDIIKRLENIEDKIENPDIYESFSIEIMNGRYGCGNDVFLYGSRIETDEELQKRINRMREIKENQEKQQIEQENRQKELYLKLKEKYE